MGGGLFGGMIMKKKKRQVEEYVDLIIKLDKLFHDYFKMVMHSSIGGGFISLIMVLFLDHPYNLVVILSYGIIGIAIWASLILVLIYYVYAINNLKLHLINQDLMHEVRELYEKRSS